MDHLLAVFVDDKIVHWLTTLAYLSTLQWISVVHSVHHRCKDKIFPFFLMPCLYRF